MRSDSSGQVAAAAALGFGRFATSAHARTKHIRLYVEMDVAPAREREMLDTFHNVFVPEAVKHERLEALVERVQRMAAERNAERIGRVEEVLVEGPSRTDISLTRGRTRRNTTVNFAGPGTPGELVDVLVETATSTTLRGRATSLVAA